VDGEYEHLFKILTDNFATCQKTSDELKEMLMQVIENTDFDFPIQNTIISAIQRHPCGLLKMHFMNILKVNPKITYMDIYDVFKLCVVKYDLETAKAILHFLIDETTTRIHKDLKSIFKQK